MFFAVSCGNSGSSGNKDNTDTGETVTDSDTADSGHGDTTPEQPDNEDPGRKQGELYGECYPNATCNKGLVCDEENNVCIKDPAGNNSDNDVSDSTPDDGDSTPEQPDDADSADDSDTSDPTDDADSADDSDPADSQPDADADSGEPEEHCETVDGKMWWSPKTPDPMDWLSAIEHCKELNKLNKCEYSDWKLPTIDELKTLIKWKRDSQCKVSDTNNCLSLSDCWTCSSCSEGCTEGANGECNCSYKYYFVDGRYSELGDAGWLWSSSVVSGYSHQAWGVNFSYAKLYYESKSNSHEVYVRCVRQD